MATNIYRRTAMAAAIATCFPAAAFAAPVARVDFAAGSVSAIAPDGRSRALSKGSEVEVGETVATGQGRAQLRFVDGAYMSLQPQTEFKVEEFKYSGKADPGDNVVMNLLKGGLRTITGLIGRTNRNAYRLKTDVATIGIRGTEYSVRYTNSIEVFVADGAISVDNQAGSFTVPGGSGVLISNQQTPPQQTDQKPVLPPESPVIEEEQQVTEKPDDPVNPVWEEGEQEVLPLPSPVTPLLTGTLSLNMAFSICLDGCTFGVFEQMDTVGTLDGSGVLTSFADLRGTTNTIGTASVAQSGNDGTIAWGRWTNGTLGGTGSLSGFNVSETNPLHYVVGLPASNMPTTGTGSYSMIGFSATCGGFGGCTSASVNSSSLSVNFGTGSVALNMQLTVNGSDAGTYTFSGSPGTISGAQIGGIAGTLVGAFSGSALEAGGFFAGDGASRAGIAWQGHINFSTDVSGTTAYAKQ
jgi:hypothetical protein